MFYPIFEECKQYTLDSYWREIFSNCAHNKFQKGIYYDPKKNFIHILENSHINESVSLPSEPTDVFQTMMFIFKNKLGLISPYEISIKDKKINEVFSIRQKNIKWKTVKQKNIRDQMLLQYITKLSSKHNLTAEQRKKLISQIHLGFHFRHITNDDVIDEDGEIQEIKNVEFDSSSKNFVFKKIGGVSSKSKSEKNSSRRKTISPFFEKFIKDYL